MDASRFQFSISVPRDPQFVSMVRGMAAQAARYSRCSEGEAETFAGSVEAAVRTCLREPATDHVISIIVRRTTGALEVLIDGRAIAVEP